METSVLFLGFYERGVDDVRLAPTHVSLYMALLWTCQRNGCTNPFSIQRWQVMRSARISSRSTYNKCMNELQQYGYLAYVPAVNAASSSTVFLKSDNTDGTFLRGE